MKAKELNTKTTNYPKDTHKVKMINPKPKDVEDYCANDVLATEEFCDRYFKHNSGCPNKCGGQFKDKEYSL